MTWISAIRAAGSWRLTTGNRQSAVSSPSDNLSSQLSTRSPERQLQEAFAQLEATHRLDVSLLPGEAES